MIDLVHHLIRDGDFVVVSADSTTSSVAFQRPLDQAAPTWPDPGVPQQMHVHVMFRDPAIARDLVRALGVKHLDCDGYADPAGHPFCLIRRPGWAAPVV